VTFISEDLVTDKSECDTSPPTVPTEGDGIPRNIRLQGTCVGKNHPTATGYFHFFRRIEYRNPRKVMEFQEISDFRASTWARTIPRLQAISTFFNAANTVPSEGDGIPRNIRLQGTCVG
jgi:hypothetical protein